VGASTVCFFYSVLFLKLWSYVQTNMWCRQTYYQKNPRERRPSITLAELSMLRSLNGMSYIKNSSFIQKKEFWMEVKKTRTFPSWCNILIISHTRISCTSFARPLSAMSWISRELLACANAFCWSVYWRWWLEWMWLWPCFNNGSFHRFGTPWFRSPIWTWP